MTRTDQIIAFLTQNGGHTINEVADKTGIPAGTVRNLLYALERRELVAAGRENARRVVWRVADVSVPRSRIEYPKWLYPGATA